MTTKNSYLTDQEFLFKFENQTLEPDFFDHQGHLRLGWLYLSHLPLELAMEKTCKGISAYARSLGASQKFNKTITVAIIKIMANRMAIGKTDTFEQFLTDNQGLMDDSLSVLLEHYSSDLLFSQQARKSEVEPDIKPLRLLPDVNGELAPVNARSE